MIARSFERIHRSNLVGMGVLPLQLYSTDSVDSLGIKDGIKPRMTVKLTITRADGKKDTVDLLCRIDTLDEIEYFKNGGILHYVLRMMAAGKAKAA